MDALPGKKILVVEDEPLVALLVADILQEAGCTVVGPAYDVSTALRFFEYDSPDAAVLDINLGNDQTSAPVADVLERAGIPFIYATGYGAAALRLKDRHKPRIDKPFDKQTLLRTLSACFSER
ncbi:response regulator [Hyphomicrobium sp.]|mgnify:CR=1 FL=1|jgi:DNA-binding NtrC family response regulator|uniref:response regulator n=1 Tax=Hyphomicrobium sp. TaxID=82 RepID=UPI002FE2B0BF